MDQRMHHHDDGSAQRAAARLADEHLFSACLDGMPVMAMVLNSRREVVAANRVLIDELVLTDASSVIGGLPGDVLACTTALAAGGCGKGELCRVCGIKAAFEQGLQERKRVRQKCHLALSGSRLRNLDCEVVAAPVCVDGEPYILTSLRDISAERRCEVVERALFHHAYTTANGLQGLASVLSGNAVRQPGLEAEYKRLMCEMAKRLMDDIRFHQQVAAAEAGKLHAATQTVSIRHLLHDLVAQYRCHESARERNLVDEAAETELTTDPHLLRRVLGNLIINACEASRPKDIITLSAAVVSGHCRIEVRNPGVIPELVRMQMFRRSFSTKPGPGHGLGTYSAKLFTERCLGGTITCVSDTGTGTVLRIELPQHIDLLQRTQPPA